MRRLLLVLVMAACGGTPSGLDDLGAFFGDLATAGEIATMACPAAMTVGQTEACSVANSVQTNVEVGGFVLAIWESSAPTIVRVTTDGEVTALAVGTATITARGTNGSSATVTVVVS